MTRIGDVGPSTSGHVPGTRYRATRGRGRRTGDHRRRQHGRGARRRAAGAVAVDAASLASSRRSQPGARSWPRCCPACRCRPTWPPCAAAVLAVKPADVAGAAMQRRRRPGRAGCCRSRPASPSRASSRRSTGHRRRRRAGDAEHAGARRCRARRRSPAARQPATTTSPGPRPSSARSGWWCVSTSPARRRHGAERLGPGVPLLRRRGAGRRPASRPGCPAELAERLTTQLLVGSAALLAARGDPARLRAEVTSPGGTTAAGIAVLEARWPVGAARGGGRGRRRPQPRARRQLIAGDPTTDASRRLHRELRQCFSDVTLFASIAVT